MGGGPSALRKAEQELLHGGVQWYSRYSKKSREVPTFNAHDVAIDEKRHIHTVEYLHPAKNESDGGTPLVCMHGYGTGIGIYYAALPALAERWRGKVYAIDSLGCGLSSRPRWHLGHGTSCRVADAEAFFIDGLERWRAEMKLEKMVLMGHSLGGYLAVAYAEKYPERVERLVLVSAVGTPEPPPQLAEMHGSAQFPFNLILGAWSHGWSPFTVAKLGLAKTMLGRYVEMRFSDASWVLKDELKEYFIGSWTDGANSAGGYAHATLLRPGGVGELAYAREPMGPTRIPSLKIGRISAIYGERDWMDWRNMAKVRSKIESEGSRGPSIEILHVADANHNMQVDNPLGFVDAVMATCNGGKHADRQMFGRKYYSEENALW